VLDPRVKFRIVEVWQTVLPDGSIFLRRIPVVSTGTFAHQPTLQKECKVQRRMKRMKKIVLGIVIAAVVAAAGSVNAATVFQKDNLTYTIKGDWQIQFRQDPGTEQDLDVEYDDLELKNNVAYKLNDRVTAFGQVDFGFKNAADKSDQDKGPHLEEAYVGFKFSDIKLFVGKTDSAADEFGVHGAKETIVASDAFGEYGEDGGDDLVGISAKLVDIFTIIATHEMEAESEKSYKNGTFYDIFVSAEFKGICLGAAYQDAERTEESDDDPPVETLIETTVWGLQISYDAGFASFEADYSVADKTETEAGVEAKEEAAIWNLFVAVPIKTVTVGAGYVSYDFDDEAKDDITGWYANAIYKFPSAKNVRLFAEIGNSDEEDSDMGYLVGCRIKF
jgi:predicted porin